MCRCVSCMNHIIVSREHSEVRDEEITGLLTRVFVDGGYTDPAKAELAFRPEALSKRGDLLLAIVETKLLGLVLCATATSPSRQVARPEEAEMHLLAVDPASRGHGVGSELVRAFEQRANALGRFRLVLSTQPAMLAAHRIYERHGYQRNSLRDWAKDGKEYLVYEKS